MSTCWTRTARRSLRAPRRWRSRARRRPVAPHRSRIRVPDGRDGLEERVARLEREVAALREALGEPRSAAAAAAEHQPEPVATFQP